jgi:hypothetical protein
MGGCSRHTLEQVRQGLTFQERSGHILRSLLNMHQLRSSSEKTLQLTSCPVSNALFLTQRHWDSHVRVRPITLTAVLHCHHNREILSSSAPESDTGRDFLMVVHHPISIGDELDSLRIYHRAVANGRWSSGVQCNALCKIRPKISSGDRLIWYDLEKIESERLGSEGIDGGTEVFLQEGL